MRSFVLIKICEILIMVLIGLFIFLLINLDYNWLSILILTNIIMLVFLLVFSKKYLYHFNYFQIYEDIKSEHNLKDNIKYKIENYENVPEPFKIKIILIITTVVYSINIIAYFINCILAKYYYKGIKAIMYSFNVYSFLESVVPSIVVLYYTYVMFQQLKYYSLYYTFLTTCEEERIINELHEK